MEYNIDDIITLNNNEKYIVVDKIIIETNTYLFLINEDDNKNNIAIVKEELKDGVAYLNNIEDEQEFERVIKYLALNHKDELLKLMEN